MANRRMFSLDIVDSDSFLSMPSTTQNLYFHLGMRADDDGVIDNPNAIKRVVGATDDDLRILIAKKFVIPFEENGLIIIKHWLIHITASSTSISLATSPQRAPRVQAASIPVIPPELGILTQRTFLMIFPLHFAMIFSGTAPSTSLAFAEAKARAMGSVHPIAGISSSASIPKKSFLIFSLNIKSPPEDKVLII